MASGRFLRISFCRGCEAIGGEGPAFDSSRFLRTRSPLCPRFEKDSELLLKQCSSNAFSLSTCGTYSFELCSCYTSVLTAEQKHAHRIILEQKLNVWLNLLPILLLCQAQHAAYVAPVPHGEEKCDFFMELCAEFCRIQNGGEFYGESHGVSGKE